MMPRCNGEATSNNLLTGIARPVLGLEPEKLRKVHCGKVRSHEIDPEYCNPAISLGSS